MTKPKKNPVGRPPTGRLRPILPRTSVAPETLKAIKSARRPAGRVIDDAITCLVAVQKCARKNKTTELQILDGLTRESGACLLAAIIEQNLDAFGFEEEGQ